MKQTTTWIVVTLAGFWGLAGCGDKKEQQQQQAPPPTPVSVYAASRQTASYYDELPATITAVNEVEVRPQVAGYITGIFFTEGQRGPERTEIIYHRPAAGIRRGLDQAVANLNAAKANLVRAQKDADRYHTLAQQDCGGAATR